MPITVKNPISDVYQRWREAMIPVVGEKNCPMSRSKTIAKATKFSRIFPMESPGTRWDLEGDECATMPSFQVDSFASGQKSFSKAFDIDEESHKVMTSMGFRRTYGPEALENEDSTIQRVTSRYTMLYTGYLLGEEKQGNQPKGIANKRN